MTKVNWRAIGAVIGVISAAIAVGAYLEAQKHVSSAFEQRLAELEGEVDGVVNRSPSLKTQAFVQRSAGREWQEFSCPRPMRVLSCHTLHVPSGQLVCSTTISEDGASCRHGGCSILGEGSWETVVVCGAVET